MYHLMGYNNDRDTYDELTVLDYCQVTYENISAYRDMLKKDEIRDKTGEPYDWLELWDDEDDNGDNDIMISAYDA